LGWRREVGSVVRRVEERAHDAYAPLRNLVAPYILRRLKTDRSVIPDLPEKTEMRAFCPLTKQQAALYQTSVDELARRMAGLDGIQPPRVFLAFLIPLTPICT